MDAKVLAKIFESMGIPEKLQSTEVQESVSAMLEEIVKNRVEALTLEHSEKEKALLEKATSTAKELEDKEAILHETAAQFAKEVKEEMVAKEAIMLEEITAYKEGIEKVCEEEGKLLIQELHKAVLEEAIQHRTSVEAIVLEEVENYKKFLEGVVTEEAQSYVSEQEQLLAKEVSTFKESMVKKVGEYFEAELPKRIPKNIMEAATKLSAYEPLIEGIVNTFSKNYVKLDSQSFDIIKESKTEIEKLSESVNAKTKDNVHLQAKVQELEKNAKIHELVEGMTVAQKGKTVKLLESCSTVEEIVSKFHQVKDLVINESVKGTPVKKVEASPTSTKSTVVLTESQKKKVESLTKTDAGSANKDPEMAAWEKKLAESLVQG
jgi:hypothetical protein